LTLRTRSFFFKHTLARGPTFSPWLFQALASRQPAICTSIPRYEHANRYQRQELLYCWDMARRYARNTRLYNFTMHVSTTERYACEGGQCLSRSSNNSSGFSGYQDYVHELHQFSSRCSSPIRRPTANALTSGAADAPEPAACAHLTQAVRAVIICTV
jgi:hypothetical protein